MSLRAGQSELKGRSEIHLHRIAFCGHLFQGATKSKTIRTQFGSSLPAHIGSMFARSATLAVAQAGPESICLGDLEWSWRLRTFFTGVFAIQICCVDAVVRTCANAVRRCAGVVQRIALFFTAAAFKGIRGGAQVVN